MFHRILNYFKQEKKNVIPIFGEKYRNGYKKLWIDQLRDYSP